MGVLTAWLRAAQTTIFGTYCTGCNVTPHPLSFPTSSAATSATFSSRLPAIAFTRQLLESGCGGGGMCRNDVVRIAGSARVKHLL